MSLGLDLMQVILAAETFGINLVNIFGAGWAQGKPPVFGNNFYAADRGVIPWGARARKNHFFAGQVADTKILGGKRLEAAALVGGGGGVDPLIERRAQRLGDAIARSSRRQATRR